jgi:Monooxygenase af470-like
MAQRPKRETVDLSNYPNLVVIYLGMRVNALTGLRTVFGFGPKISAAVDAKPDGLLLHENILFSLRHLGMRQYWRDFESLEAWSRSDPHRLWWQQFLRNSGGTGFWHETYFRNGGIEAVYVDVQSPIGLARFAPVVPARGSMFSARKRASMSGAPQQLEPVTEEELYPADRA